MTTQFLISGTKQKRPNFFWGQWSAGCGQNYCVSTRKPKETVRSKEHTRGEKWSDLRAEARSLYGIDKGEYFRTVGRRAKVEYTY